ncbi:hypothetical protein [Bdellovibrio sp. KM01]|uniref:hypothetical protein n=1 Tax=Bdellovibrio sp. KM01 TaxID=2748865 RepID=UPI0015EA912C|nr:hypothetical protein [Bdellovibrio sp. KM01]QLY24328.1 hypothetical protein HW988_12735 [Bdellovibrio sp. KM01]
MLRAGRFRHRLLDETFLENHSAQAVRSLTPFVQMWTSQKISDEEMVGAYLLTFTFLRRPTDFLGGLHNLPLPRNHSRGVSGNLIVSTLRQTLPEELNAAKSLRPLETDGDFVMTFTGHSWRSIPFSVQKSLSAWKAGLYPLNLLTHLPTADDVLLMQAQGQRCVSMLLKPDEIHSFVEEGRDVLGFIVHDLIHADHFFNDPLRAQAQVHFCQKLLEVLKLPAIQHMLFVDEVFRKEFHYLMSDMNSVPLHLLKTLKAVLLGYFKRQHNTDMKQALPVTSEKHFAECYRQVLAAWNFSALEFAAAQRLNTPHFQYPTDSVLLDQALGKNHSPTENYLVIS